MVTRPLLAICREVVFCLTSDDRVISTALERRRVYENHITNKIGYIDGKQLGIYVF